MHSKVAYSDGAVPAGAGDKSSKAAGKAASRKSVLEGLEELWDENQYAEEFSLADFTSKLTANS